MGKGPRLQPSAFMAWLALGLFACRLPLWPTSEDRNERSALRIDFRTTIWRRTTFRTVGNSSRKAERRLRRTPASRGQQAQTRELRIEISIYQNTERRDNGDVRQKNDQEDSSSPSILSPCGFVAHSYFSSGQHTSESAGQKHIPADASIQSI